MQDSQFVHPLLTLRRPVHAIGKLAASCAAFDCSLTRWRANSLGKMADLDLLLTSTVNTTDTIHALGHGELRFRSCCKRRKNCVRHGLALVTTKSAPVPNTIDMSTQGDSTRLDSSSYGSHHILVATSDRLTGHRHCGWAT